MISRISVYSPSNDVWSDAGKLNSGHYYHNAILSGNQFIVMGGNSQEEICTPNGNQVTCVQYRNYVESYPQLFNVDSDYCR